jgi:hypothetical protein
MYRRGFGHYGFRAYALGETCTHYADEATRARSAGGVSAGPTHWAWASPIAANDSDLAAKVTEGARMRMSLQFCYEERHRSYSITL